MSVRDLAGLAAGYARPGVAGTGSRPAHQGRARILGGLGSWWEEEVRPGWVTVKGSWHEAEAQEGS